MPERIFLNYLCGALVENFREVGHFSKNLVSVFFRKPSYFRSTPKSSEVSDDSWHNRSRDKISAKTEQIYETENLIHKIAAFVDLKPSSNCATLRFCDKNLRHKFGYSDFLNWRSTVGDVWQRGSRRLATWQLLVTLIFSTSQWNTKFKCFLKRCFQTILLLLLLLPMFMLTEQSFEGVTLGRLFPALLRRRRLSPDSLWRCSSCCSCRCSCSSRRSTCCHEGHAEPAKAMLAAGCVCIIKDFEVAAVEFKFEKKYFKTSF